ncbi:MtnX-like HAD-IB family phosphatase [Paenibacillus cymbidii]|uniref:MtnX-like HAD-IB family phosphatase n=1 Tax=Paenibacillus cymbidii TaxID=1639034 RepID=UPI001436A648|nr:MtnX-like HAD-IB family phosphatase [Paenibacillus cymbidii]
MGNLYVVTDFDGTLMHEDVGDELMEALGVVRDPALQEAVRKLRTKEGGSREWIMAAYPHLAGRKDEVDAVIGRVRLRDGAKRFLRYCEEQDVPVTVLSDGMAYYIETILAREGVQPAQTIANPIRYLPDGGYELKLQNDNAACSWCGCCKADVVRELKRDGSFVVYIGDGTSDYYGSAFADWVFARGTLAQYLTREGEAFFPFESFDDVLAVLQPQLASFRAGTAAGRRGRTNDFCRFA